MSILVVDRADAVATLTLNRPDSRNALNVDLLVALREAFAALSSEQKVRAVILTGARPAFCAGADVKEWAAEKTSSTPTRDWVAEAIHMMQSVRDCPKPVIASIDGACVGAGLDLALCADFRLASERSKFICSYTHLAYPPDAGGTWLLPRIVGLQAARHFIYTGETWLGPRAAEHGLIDQSLPEEQLSGAVAVFADQLAHGPTRAIAEAKRLLTTSFSNTFAEQLALEQAAGKRCAATSDHAEALAAAGARRRAEFLGL